MLGERLYGGQWVSADSLKSRSGRWSWESCETQTHVWPFEWWVGTLVLSVNEDGPCVSTSRCPNCSWRATLTSACRLVGCPAADDWLDSSLIKVQEMKIIMVLFCLASGEETPITLFSSTWLKVHQSPAGSGSEKVPFCSGRDINYDFNTRKKCI